MQSPLKPDDLTIQASPSRQRLPSRRECILSLLACAAGSSALAQEGDVTFSTGIKLVNVLVTARDKKGHYVQDLTQQDFEIKEDGYPQKITYFTRETEAPLSLGMLVDTSGSQRNVMEQERIAGLNFLTGVLRPDRDTACVLAFDGRVLKIQGMTNSLPRLENALEILDIRNPLFSDANIYGGTFLHDAVFLASEEILREREGRKALIVLSDGGDYGSRTSLEQAILAAHKADTAVYAIHIADPATYYNFTSMGGPVGNRRGRLFAANSDPSYGVEQLKHLAEETGGSDYVAVRLEEAFFDIGEALRSQYSIGYVSDRDPEPGKFHKLEVRTKRSGIKLQARTGYYVSP